MHDKSKLKDVADRVAKIPRVKLAYLPTPLEFLPRLTEHLGGANLWIKRDNQTGLATGGNKTRKLEFAMVGAVNAGATHIITCGAQQSNHARQTCAAAVKLGMKFHVCFENRRNVTLETNPTYLLNGNVLLIDIFGGTHEEFPGGTDMNKAMKEASEKIRQEGGVPYIIPGGASDETGAVAYVECALEVIRQAEEMGLRIDHFVTASGSAGTHAGLATGFQATDSDVKLLGIGTRLPQDKQEDKVHGLTMRLAKYLGLPSDRFKRDYIKANCNYIGTGYGHPSEGTFEAILTLARMEGILVEPAYTGKAMDGLIDLVKGGYFKKGENVVFLHTGGEAAVFGYEGEIRAKL